jgi:hypothetical protein
MVRHHASGLVSMALNGHVDGSHSRHRGGLSAVAWPFAFRSVLGLPAGFAACTVLLAGLRIGLVLPFALEHSALIPLGMVDWMNVGAEQPLLRRLSPCHAGSHEHDRSLCHEDEGAGIANGGPLAAGDMGSRQNLRGDRHRRKPDRNQKALTFEETWNVCKNTSFIECRPAGVKDRVHGRVDERADFGSGHHDETVVRRVTPPPKVTIGELKFGRAAGRSNDADFHLA